MANLITEIPSLTQLTRVNIHTSIASEAADAVKGSITISQNGQEVEFLGEKITQSMAATLTSPWLTNIKYIKCPPASSITINQRQHTSELGKMMISAKRSEVELEGQVPVYWIAAICLKWGKDTMNITGASSIMDSSDLSIHHVSIVFVFIMDPRMHVCVQIAASSSDIPKMDDDWMSITGASSIMGNRDQSISHVSKY